MDFFDRQRQAKKKTSTLVFLFCIGVLLISLLNFFLLSLFVIPIASGGFSAEGNGNVSEIASNSLKDPILAIWVVLGTFLIISLAGLFRKFQLKEGGASIASMMGGRLVNSNSRDPDEKKLLNVVEEMAIASSVPKPDIYVMDGEKGINAFAAGHALDDAVIGVTDGCIRQLNRDELQAVIAHEFSHILNQDMKLNLRLVSVVFGLLVLSQIGRLMMEVAFSSSRYSRRSSRDNNGGGGGLVIAIGCAGACIMATGVVGVLMGNLIKSAVSRQREYLADSSAVQFTRNPEGLSGALKKIGALSYGSRLLSPNSNEVSHMFFGNGMKESWFSISSTHPPLLERIKLLEPGFNGDFSEVKFEKSKSLSIDQGGGAKGSQAPIPLPGMDGALGQSLPPVVMGLTDVQDVKVKAPSSVMLSDSIGNPSQEHFDFAAELIKSLPKLVMEATRDTHDACALVFALLLDKKNELLKQKQIEEVEDLFGGGMSKATLKLSRELVNIDSRARLPIVDLAIGSLRNMSQEQYEYFNHIVERLVEADGQVDLFEYSLSKLVVSHLEPHFIKRRKKTVQVYSLKRLGHDCSVLISALAYAAGSEGRAIDAAYKAGADHLASLTELNFLSASECGLNDLDLSLATLVGVAPNLKRELIRAASMTVSIDGYLQVQEAELLRAICDVLGCPVPPLSISMEEAA